MSCFTGWRAILELRVRLWDLRPLKKGVEPGYNGWCVSQSQRRNPQGSGAGGLNYLIPDGLNLVRRRQEAGIGVSFFDRFFPLVFHSLSWILGFLKQVFWWNPANLKFGSFLLPLLFLRDGHGWQALNQRGCFGRFQRLTLRTYAAGKVQYQKRVVYGRCVSFWRVKGKV